MCASVEETNKHLIKHLESHKIYIEDPPWTLQPSPLGDRGIFATKDLQPGELIYVDSPLIIGPRSGVDIPKICVVCYQDSLLKLCPKGCGLTICCGSNCESAKTHLLECNLILKWQNDKTTPEEISRYLAPIRSLFLTDSQKNLVRALKSHFDPRHGFEVDALKDLHFEISESEEKFMRLVCAVLDANAFAVISGNEDTKTSLRGLYPLASLANHSCFPNTTHIFDEQQRMITKAAVFIPRGAELFTSYTRTTWGTITRRFHLLRTKHFCCYCDRCRSPDEFGAYLSALFCAACNGFVLPIDQLKFNSGWKCKGCGKKYKDSDARMMASVLGSRLASFQPDDVEDMIKFLEIKSKNLVPACNQVMVELKLKLILIFGYKENYNWSDLSDVYLTIKEKICQEMLQLLATLKLGQCKMRGVLLYEFCCCLRERHRRIEFQTQGVETNNNCKVSQDDIEIVQKYLQEATDIMEFDVSAPEEIKRLWLQKSITENAIFSKKSHIT